MLEVPKQSKEVTTKKSGEQGLWIGREETQDSGVAGFISFVAADIKVILPCKNYVVFYIFVILLVENTLKIYL